MTEGDQMIDDEPGAEPFFVDDGVEVLRVPCSATVTIGSP